jgi:hypothetical protein
MTTQPTTKIRDFREVGVFGSELLPPTSVIEKVSAITVAFKSDPDAILALLPYHFEPAAAMVRVSHLTYKGIDYLANRGYNVLSVSVPAVYVKDRSITGNYNVVLWEGLSHAVNLGRELQGYAKIYGEIPDATENETSRSFECNEYGATLLRGEVHDLVEISADRLGRLQERSSEAKSLGWKYIPGPKLTEDPDCDYATRVSNPLFYDQAWTGEGTVEFCSPTWEEAPVSTRILTKLRALPNFGYERAFVGTGSASAPRVGVERLD